MATVAGTIRKASAPVIMPKCSSTSPRAPKAMTTASSQPSRSRAFSAAWTASKPTPEPFQASSSGTGGSIRQEAM
jgi:hypothetical protein